MIKLRIVNEANNRVPKKHNNACMHAGSSSIALDEAKLSLRVQEEPHNNIRRSQNPLESMRA